MPGMATTASKDGHQRHLDDAHVRSSAKASVKTDVAKPAILHKCFTDTYLLFLCQAGMKASGMLGVAAVANMCEPMCGF